VIGLPAGFVVWTLTEYFAHRFAMHNTGGRGPAAHEHLMHHAKPARTRRLIRTLGHVGMYTTATVAALAMMLIVAPAWAIATAGGWAIGYTLYEFLHFASHHRPPLGAWDLRLRHRHFHHHFVAPRQNLGVMVNWWDRLLGTEAELHQIRVPRRVAMAWLIDAEGNVRTEYADTYTVVGPAHRSAPVDTSSDPDVIAAFADRPLPLTL